MILVILTLIAVGALLASDLFLPALPQMGEFFAKSDDQMQLTISIYLFGLAIAQLIWGTLSGKLGRRNSILLGFGLFTIGTIVCIMTNNFNILLLGRFIQSIGASAGLLIVRVVISDMFPKQESGKAFATISPFIGMSPALAPVLGGLLSGFLGWRFCFVALLIYCILMIYLIYKNLPETMPPNEENRFNPLQYMKLFLNIKFIFYLISPCFAYATYLIYIAQSPFIFHDHGFSEQVIGFCYISISFAYVAGTLHSRAYLKNNSLDDSLRLGYLINLAGGFLMLLNAVFLNSIFGLIATMSIIAFANGKLIPMGIAGAMSEVRGKSAGYGSAIVGFCQLMVASLVVTYASEISQNSPLRLQTFIFSLTLVAFFVRKYLHKKILQNSN